MNSLSVIIAVHQNEQQLRAYQRSVQEQWAQGNFFRVRFTSAEFLIPLQRERFFQNATELADWYEASVIIARRKGEHFRIERMWAWINGQQVELDDFTPFIAKLSCTNPRTALS